MSLPILGLRVRLRGESAKTHRIVLEATFIDGSAVGPVGGGDPCEAESLAALEAFRIAIEPIGIGAPAGRTTKAPAKPVAKPSAKSAAKPAPVVAPAPAPKAAKVAKTPVVAPAAKQKAAPAAPTVKAGAKPVVKPKATPAPTRRR